MILPLCVVGHLKSVSLPGHRAPVSGITHLLKAAQLGTGKLDVTLKAVSKNGRCQVIAIQGVRLA